MVRLLSPSDNTNVLDLFDSNTNTFFFPSWKIEQYPFRIKIDFGKKVQISRINYFDAQGQPILSFYDPINLLGAYRLGGYMEWVHRDVNWHVDSIIVEIEEMEGDGVIRELEFYTDFSNPNEPDIPPIVVPSKLTGAASRISTNAFHWITMPVMKHFATARLYMALQFIMRDGKYYGSPFYQAGVAHALSLDDYLVQAKRENLDILLCCNQSPTDIAIHWGGDPECKPIDPNADPLDPASYLLMGRFFFNMAARYGKVKVDHSRLEVNKELRWGAKNEIKSGLGLLRWIELWNEQWAWWRGDDSKFTPEEYAVMFYMCYDGCGGRFPNCGVAQADESFELVMGGMSEMNTEHLTRFVNHLTLLGADLRIVKTVNFHHYCNVGEDKPDGYTPGQWTEGQRPEENNLEGRLLKMNQWRTSYLPWAKMMYSEFGYDSGLHGQSWQKSHGEVNQANWLLRTYLLGLKMNIDYLYMFNIVDGENSANGDLWSTSGMHTNQATGYQPKLAMYGVTSLIRELNGFEFRKDVSINAFTRILLFKKGKTLKYFYWNVRGESDIVIGNTILKATEEPKFRTLRAYEPSKIKLIKIYDNNTRLN